MTPRVQPVEEPDENQRELLARTLHGPDGEPLNLFTTLAHRPKLMSRVNALGGFFMAHGSLPVRARELVILRTAAHARSEYEIGQHRWLGAKAGLSGEEIEAAIDLDYGHAWSAPDRALLSFTDELVRTDTVSDACWDRLAEDFDELQRMELLMLAGFYRMLAGVLNGLRVDLDEAIDDKGVRQTEVY